MGVSPAEVDAGAVHKGGVDVEPQHRGGAEAGGDRQADEARVAADIQAALASEPAALHDLASDSQQASCTASSMSTCCPQKQSTEGRRGAVCVTLAAQLGIPSAIGTMGRQWSCINCQDMEEPQVHLQAGVLSAAGTPAVPIVPLVVAVQCNILSGAAALWCKRRAGGKHRVHDQQRRRHVSAEARSQACIPFAACVNS